MARVNRVGEEEGYSDAIMVEFTIFDIERFIENKRLIIETPEGYGAIRFRAENERKSNERNPEDVTPVIANSSIRRLFRGRTLNWAQMRFSIKLKLIDADPAVPDHIRDKIWQ